MKLQHVLMWATRCGVLAAAFINVAPFYAAAGQTPDQSAARSAVFQRPDFSTPISLDLPDDLSPATEKWYRAGWNVWPGAIPPAAGRVTMIPEHLRDLTSKLQLISIFEMPMRVGNDQPYFRYTQSLAPLLLPSASRKQLRIAHRDLKSVSYSYENCYDIDPLGMGRTKVCSMVFSYRILSDIPGVTVAVGTGEGRAKTVRDLDTGRWVVAEFELNEPKAEVLGQLIGQKLPEPPRVAQPNSSSSSPASTVAPGSVAAPNTSVPRGAPPASIADFVPGGAVGTFRHGTKVSACYSDTALVDIQPRGVSFSKTCARTRLLVHAGVDIAAPRGAEVRPLADGTVTNIVGSAADSSFSSLGYAVVVKHESSVSAKPTWSIYLHFDQPPSVEPGDRVSAGRSVLGYVGRSGAAFGFHTHIEVRHFADRLSPKWRNIYGVEAPSSQGGTFDPTVFAADWEDPESFLRAAVAAVVEAPVVPGEQSFRDGYRRYADGDYSGAAAFFERSAAEGNSRAAGFLGVMQMQGMGVPSNIVKAVGNLTIAANSGEPGAAFNLGEIYWDGRGIRKDQKLAAQWYSRALEGFLKGAANGDLESMTMAGRIYAEGGGVKANPAEALKWLVRASDRQFPKAQRLLGELYVQGRIVAKNRSEGVRLLSLAARAGDRLAQDTLRRLGEVW